MALAGIVGALFLLCAVSNAKEYHVSQGGSDAQDGSRQSPFRTIAAAARIAIAGDTITVHAGIYRERVDPPRGGTSDAQRIVYRAAPGEAVTIKGSEIVRGWQHVANDTWLATVPGAVFGGFNPFADTINGDWFTAYGPNHHTGAVYLDGHWLTEARSLEHVMLPIGKAATEYDPETYADLLNLASFRVDPQSTHTRLIDASAYSAQEGLGTAPCAEGGTCIAWTNHHDWAAYDMVDFGKGTTEIAFRAASHSRGGAIEIRLDSPNGELLGSCLVPNTGGWQTWSSFTANIKNTGGMHSVYLVFTALPSPHPPDVRLWFADVGASTTRIWAQFKDVDPNEHLTEVNVRQSVFYPGKTGINYLTVSGFTMMHAATPWAPPTAEQIGLIGTNWSKGWIIEDNTIRYSVCSGIALGKHGDAYDNTSANSAEGYVKTIERATARGWSKENIGHHIVRNNTVSHCEQAGIVGSMGAVFSTITGNTVHDIHVRRLFTGAEMAGIKIHGAIDTEISNNHIYRCCRGIWLDWMAQGAHVTRNLLHDNHPSEDLFVEVNHGPLLADNNLFLSTSSIVVNSQGEAFVHNLIAGNIWIATGETRETPYLREHSTEVAGLAPNASGDERYYNNIVVNGNLDEFDKTVLPVFLGGNVLLRGARPSRHEPGAFVDKSWDPRISLMEKPDGFYLQMSIDRTWSEQQRQLVTTGLLGKAKTPGLPYVRPDGSPYSIDTDYFGHRRNMHNPCVGPFEYTEAGDVTLKVW